jgi:hypothetical protein
MVTNTKPGGGGLEDKGKRTMVGNMESIVKVQNALWNKKGTQKTLSI